MQSLAHTCPDHVTPLNLSCNFISWGDAKGVPDSHTSEGMGTFNSLFLVHTGVTASVAAARQRTMDKGTRVGGWERSTVSFWCTLASRLPLLPPDKGQWTKGHGWERGSAVCPHIHSTHPQRQITTSIIIIITIITVIVIIIIVIIIIKTTIIISM